MQHWINKFFHITDAESAPIIITLLVFITGGVAKTIYTFLVNIAARREIRRQFYLLTEDMARNANVQGDRYIETSEGLTTDGLKPLSMGVADFYQPSIFKDIGYVRTFESIFIGLENRLFFRLTKRKKKIEAFFECWKAIFSIIPWQERASESIKFVLGYYNTQIEKRNKGLTQFERLTYEMYRSLAGNAQADYARSYLKEVLDIKTEWGKMTNSTAPNISQEHLVKPILKISMNSTYDGAQAIRFCLMDVESDYINLERMMENYKQQFVKYSEHLKHYSSQIMESRKAIRNRKHE